MRDDGIVRIAGREVVALVDKLDLATPAGVRELSIELDRLGVIDALRHAGVKPGHDVAIGDERFEFSLPPEEAHARPRRRRGGRSRMVSADTPRVGVLGSLCNPVHLGHLLLCQEATWQLGLSRVVLVPTGMPPHRPAPPESAAHAPAPGAGGGHRQPGADRLARRDRAPGPVLHGRHAAASWRSAIPGNGLVLLLGSDQYAALSTWHEPERVPQLARIAVARRPGVSPDVLADADIERIEMPQVDISSSMIRERVAAGRPIRHLVPDPVRELIEAEGLYRIVTPTRGKVAQVRY